MADMYSYLVENGNDHMVIPVVGGVNTAKSSLSMLIEWYLNNGNVELDTFAYEHEDWYSTHTSRPLRKVIKYEEGRDSFYRRNAMSNKNKEAMNGLYKYRKYQHLNLINFQNASDMEPDLVKQISHGMFRCVKPGWVWFYNQRSMRSMWNAQGKFTGWVEPDFKDGFPDPANKIPEVWKDYEQQSLEVLDNDSSDSEESEFDIDDYYKATTVAEKLDMNRTTIYDWVKEDKLPGMKFNGKWFVEKKGLKKKLEKEAVKS